MVAGLRGLAGLLLVRTLGLAGIQGRRLMSPRSELFLQHHSKNLRRAALLSARFAAGSAAVFSALAVTASPF